MDKLITTSKPSLQTPQQYSDRIYHKFLRVINEPLSKSEKNSRRAELRSILAELKHQVFDVLGLFTFILSLIFVLLLIAFPKDPWLVVLFIAFTTAYFIVFLSALMRRFIIVLKTVFKPWNEFIFHETLSKEKRPDADIEAVKARLIKENFTSEDLVLLQARVKLNFEKDDDKLKNVVEFLTKCIVIITIISGITKEFAGSRFPTSREILTYGLCFGGISIVMLIYRLIREMKFDKLLTAIERTIDYREGIKNELNDAANSINCKDGN